VSGGDTIASLLDAHDAKAVTCNLLKRDRSIGARCPLMPSPRGDIVGADPVQNALRFHVRSQIRTPIRRSSTAPSYLLTACHLAGCGSARAGVRDLPLPTLEVRTMSRRVIGLFASAIVMACVGAQPLFAQGRGVNPSVSTVHGNSAHDSTPKGSSLTVSQRIEQNPKLTARLQALLPAGMTLDQAAAGFKNQGQFVAALHVAHNLGISFVDLKADMTGPNHDSLGKAIHALKPTVDASAEVKKADTEADTDLKVSKSDTNKS
jgi:hypothetical protein